MIPVTISLFAEDNYVLSEILPFCKKNNRPILPVLYDTAVLSEFNAIFENMQYIDPFSQDGSAEPYEMKLQKYLDSVLISDELAGRVKAAFDAYIFLSYRKKDRVLAQKLMRLIHANPDCRDIAIWYDEFLVPGQSFSESIEQALKSSDVFALAVTPNLLEEGNYVMEIEYKSAAENHVPVVSAELAPTDRMSLEKYYKDIPPCISTDEPSPIKDALLANLKNTALLTNSGDPQHDFFIGLAYLNGIDVEVDHEKALELITSAARSDLPEAREKLVSMYRYGEGVARDPQKAADWQYGLTLTYETAYEENAVDYLTYARSLENLAEMYIENEEYEDAEETLEQLLLLSGEPEFWTKRFDQYAYRRLGDIQAKNLNDREAQYNYRKSLRSISDLRKDNSTVGVWLESALDSYATGMQLLGKDDAAADECFSYAYSIGQRLAQIADDKGVAAEAKRCSILFSCAMAEGPKRTGNLPVAKHFLDNALKNAREMDAEYRSVRTQKNLYVTLNKLGDFYLFNKKEAETAAKYYEEGLELTKKVYESLGTENVKTDLAFSLNRLGEMVLSTGEAVEAADLFGQSLELLKEIDRRSSTTKSRQDVAIAEEALTKALRNAGKSGQADDHLENAMHIR